MEFHKENLDLILVPSGFLIMFAYHLLLLYRYLNRPHKTVIGFENNDKRAWIYLAKFAKPKICLEKKSVVVENNKLSADLLLCNGQADEKDVGTALSVIQSSITSANFLASVSLSLCALIGAWFANNSSNFFQSELIYGDTRPTIISIKYMCLLICFLLAFSFFIQSTRHFVGANYLISTPDCRNLVSSVEVAVIKGGDFWSLGLCALYFALNLLLWFFGPIPFFVSSVVMVIILYFRDYNSRPLHPDRSPGDIMHKSRREGLREYLN
ncbi:hypothetical protein L6164_029708 [Bauhinia variegata]|uniref:Uncharacterized protein n=1 Tax=Bauhinia variegata TaxID=167791 RepID=A0ACB9L9J4_BAUVA|nr:hypothetical protein L6164_029708 [Bauhinia variegata]